jgi:protein disulfide-isomerase A1
MIHKSLVLLFCALASAFAAFPEEDNVLVLTDANFDEAIKAHDHILVEFYAPWCGHCKKLAPEWASAAGTLLSSGSSVRLAKVDATESKSLGERFDIKGFPTIKMFKAGTPSDYQGGRSAADIVAYARKQSGPPAKTISTAAELDALQAAGEVVVVGYFADAASAEAKAFISQATADDERQYVISSSEEVKSKLGAAGDHVVLFKPYDEGRADHAVAAGTSRDDLNKFVNGNALPLVNEFNAENSKKIFSSPIKVSA